MAKANLQTATNGSVRVPFDQRNGVTSDVFFTRDLSPEGLRRAVAKVAPRLSGKIAIKLHTGEKDGPNIIPFGWVKDLVSKDLPDATIVETNTYYEGDRYTTERHRETIAHNGWTFCPVDIMDEEGVATLPVAGGKWFNEMHVGTHMLNYNSMLTLTHFKGHTMGGFGGSNKNLGIGCADGRIGKGEIHTVPGSDNLWSIAEAELCDNHHLVERIETRHGLRQLSYMHELGMGNWKYRLLDLDNGEAEITQAEAVAHVTPFEG